MNIQVSFAYSIGNKIRRWARLTPWYYFVFTTAIILAVLSTEYYYYRNLLVAYGDAESHLNIAKRVVSSLTPGIAQLGGIWLPIPHIMMIPFVYFDSLWRSGLAGSIVSGFSYVVTSYYLFKIIRYVTKSRLASYIGSFIFMTNPNILYLQSTAMTELPLIMFFTASGYHFIRFLRERNLKHLVAASLFGFLAALSRYDGWFLITTEAGIILLQGIISKFPIRKIEGMLVLYSTLAFFAIVLWLAWGQLILGNALYFTQSEFSAHAQQQNWLMKGELPAYHNLLIAILYYTVTSMSNSGVMFFILGISGFLVYAIQKNDRERLFISVIFMVPFIFNILTLYLGQSVIFIPHLTPVSFEWRLFNVRYGTMMVAPLAFFSAYLISKMKSIGILIFIGFFCMQLVMYTVGYSSVISLEDGVTGLSHAKRPDAELFMAKNYDGGLVLMDDYTRTMSIIRSGVPMKNIIYIGTKPYWEESLVTPEKHATWIVMQKDDSVWKSLFSDAAKQGRLYVNYAKAYTSPEIIIFKRINNI